jgi:hypothetical protein
VGANVTIKKEIETIENIIKLLNQCYMMYRQTKNYEEAMQILKDIQVCKNEIERVLAAGEIKEKQTHEAIQ